MALSAAQQAELIVVLKGKNPDQLQLPGVLWDRAAVRALIKKLFGLALTRQTVGVYLRKWGFSGKKPERRWAEQDPARVKAWLEQEYPKIKARARKEGALLLFGDEMGVRAGQTAGKTYSPRGQRAIVKVTGKRFSANVISVSVPTARSRSTSSREPATSCGSWTSWTSCWPTSPSATRSS